MTPETPKPKRKQHRVARTLTPSDEEKLAGKAKALAAQNCAACFGLGLIAGNKLRSRVCSCVYRAVFRIVHADLRRVAMNAHLVYLAGFYTPDFVASARAESMRGAESEFLADFELMAYRALNRNQTREQTGGKHSELWNVFRFHYLLGADWSLCCQRLGLTRGDFFHANRRIQELCGQAFFETKPRALYPTDEYFSPSKLGDNCAPCAVATASAG